MAFELPKLPYDYKALEPVIDAETMELHHQKHHNAYLTKFNAAIEGTEWASKSVEDILKHVNDLPAKIQSTVRNNGGGFYNHCLFWEVMCSPAGQEPSGALAEGLKKAFGSVEKFKSTFSEAAATRFGSGWAWLVVTSNGDLAVTSTANQDAPIMGTLATEVVGEPILGLDVWEHAYYLNYRNRRPEYIENWWKVVNWDAVGKRFSAVK